MQSAGRSGIQLTHSLILLPACLVVLRLASCRDEAFQSLQQVREAKQEITLLAARFVGPSNKKADFYSKCGIRSAEAFLESAEQLLKDGTGHDWTARLLVLC